MKTTVDYLDALKARHGGISDYKIARLLDVSQQAVSKYRTGRDFLGDSAAIRIAQLLEIDPAIVIACAHQERAKKVEEKAVWESIFQKLGGAAAALILAVGVGGAPNTANASGIDGGDNYNYVK